MWAGASQNEVRSPVSDSEAFFHVRGRVAPLPLYTVRGILALLVYMVVISDISTLIEHSINKCETLS